MKLGEAKRGARSLVGEGEALDGFFAVRVASVIKMGSEVKPHEKSTVANFTSTKPALPPVGPLQSMFDPTAHTFQSLISGTFTTHRGSLIGPHWDLPTGFTGKVKLRTPTELWGMQYQFVTLPEIVPSTFFVAFEGGPAPANKVKIGAGLFRVRGNGNELDKIYKYNATRGGQALTPVAPPGVFGSPLFLLEGADGAAGAPIKFEIDNGQVNNANPLPNTGKCILFIQASEFAGDATRPPVAFGFTFKGP